ECQNVNFGGNVVEGWVNVFSELVYGFLKIWSKFLTKDVCDNLVFVKLVYDDSMGEVVKILNHVERSREAELRFENRVIKNTIGGKSRSKNGLFCENSSSNEFVSKPGQNVCSWENWVKCGSRCNGCSTDINILLGMRSNREAQSGQA
ncbi:unnamed protein product, partial [Allacma fusca]